MTTEERFDRGVIVMGAGAMGSVYGAALTEAGIKTTLVDVDQDLVGTLRSDGLKLVREGEARVVELDVRTDADGLGPVDAVVFFVKAHATDAAAELVAPAVDEGTLVLSLQNGWGAGERLAALYAPPRVVIGVSYQSATRRGRGWVERTAPGATVVGPLVEEGAAAAAAVVDLLDRAGLEPELCEDVVTRIWEKLVLNAAANPTAALARLSAGELIAAPEMRDLVHAIALETIAVAAAEGRVIEPRQALAHIEATLAEAGDGKGSMLQDVEAGRKTEIDVITGAVLRAAERQGVDAPLNRTIYALVKGYEHSRDLASGASDTAVVPDTMAGQ